eukprot:3339946-Rhodomonas_salina.4
MSRERNHGALSPANEKGLSGELLRSMVGSLILCRLGRKSETGEAATLGGSRTLFSRRENILQSGLSIKKEVSHSTTGTEWVHLYRGDRAKRLCQAAPNYSRSRDLVTILTSLFGARCQSRWPAPGLSSSVSAGNLTVQFRSCAARAAASSTGH